MPGPVLAAGPGDFSDELSVGGQLAHKPGTVGPGPLDGERRNLTVGPGPRVSCSYPAALASKRA